MGEQYSTISEGKGLIVILCLILITIVFLGFAANQWRHNFSVKQTDVDGNIILSDEEILQLANIPDSAGLYDLDLRLMRERILQQPYIKDVVINRELPSTLKIKVTERRPVAILNNTNLLYLDQEGYVLPHTSSRDIFDLPIISGLTPPIDANPGEKIELTEIQTAMEIFSVAQEVNEELYHFISEVDLNNRRDILIYSAEWGVPIIFGRGEALRKLVYLDAFLKQYAIKRGLANIIYIDLRFDKQVVVRWAQGEMTKQAPTLLTVDKGAGQH